MRFKKTIPPILRGGERRVISYFAWIPVTIKNREVKETRWLERITVEQRFELGWCDNEWCNIRFIN
jgi:hypothetical protein